MQMSTDLGSGVNGIVLSAASARIPQEARPFERHSWFSKPLLLKTAPFESGV